MKYPGYSDWYTVASLEKAWSKNGFLARMIQKPYVQKNLIQIGSVISEIQTLKQRHKLCTQLNILLNQTEMLWLLEKSILVCHKSAYQTYIFKLKSVKSLTTRSRTTEQIRLPSSQNSAVQRRFHALPSCSIAGPSPPPRLVKSS